MFVGDPIYPVFYTEAASKQNYHPEWINTGSALTDTTFFARAYDKSQWNHNFGLSLLTARIDDDDEVVCWSWERPDGGRSFGFVGLHFHSNWQRPEYRRLAVQGVLWTLGFPVPKNGVNIDMDAKTLELK